MAKDVTGGLEGLQWGGRRGGVDEVLYEGDEGARAGAGDPGVAQDDGHLGPEVERSADLVRLVAVGAVELVDGDDESDAAPFEEVHRGEAFGEAPGVGQHDGSEGALGEFVPHEPEAFLARCAEQIEHVLLGEGDAAEVHGDGGGRLGLDALQIVRPHTDLGQQFLGAQRGDLADRAHERRLADTESMRRPGP